MSLLCLGLSHHTAPVEVRERHAFPPSVMGQALIALREYPAVREAAMLSTCNRLEIYAEVEDEKAGTAQLKEFLFNFRHAGVDYDLEPYLYTLSGQRAVEQLLRVATGLDSMLLGETEILGQVREAYRQAQYAQSAGNVLHHLFREALQAGREARSQTAIGSDSVSVATAAIAKAREHVGDLRGRNVLIIGAGKMGQTAAKRLRLEGARTLTIVNRTAERARELVNELGFGEAAEFAELGPALAAADVIVTSTGATHYVLTVDNVSAAMLERPNRPLFIIDIAVPRDADPAIAELAGVRVTDLDQLASVVDVTLEHRRAAVPLVEAIVAEHAERTARWYDEQLTIPVITSLTQRAERIRHSELERLFARCSTLSERDRTLVSGMSHAILAKLLHTVIARLRSHAGSDRETTLEHARVLAELFDLQMDAAGGATNHR